jgi:hypothetical protein
MKRVNSNQMGINKVRVTSPNIVKQFRELVFTSFNGLPVLALVIFLISTIFSVLVFNQGDLSHTTKSSFAFLDGHFLDFYDVNKVIVGGNDYFPLLYAVFAIWFIPLKLFGFASDDSLGFALLPIEIVWAKLLLALFLFSTLLVVNLIARELFPNETKRQQVVIFTYLLSPFALFAATVFGQYDVIGLFFTLLGFLYYLRGNTGKFVLFFAIAISLKFFALVIFVPLVVLKYKSIWKILYLFALSSLAVLLQVILYSGSPVFRESAFRLLTSKTGNASNEQLTSFVAILFIIGCFYLWRIKPNSESLAKHAVFAACASYGVMFEVVVWHPQWLIIMTPFFAMAVGYYKRPTTFLVWEAIAFLGFIWCVVNWWMYNVDSPMIERGAFSNIFNHHQLILSDIYEAARTREFKYVLELFFISPLIYLLVESVSPKFALSFKMPKPWVWISRSLLIPAIWTIPTLFAFVVPLSIAQNISPGAPAYSMDTETIGKDATSVTPELLESDTIEQSFVASKDKLSGIAIRAATYRRSNEGFVTISVTDSLGKIVAKESMPAAKISEVKKTYLWFEPKMDSAGKTYFVKVTSSGNLDRDRSLSLWQTPTDGYFKGQLSINGVAIDGDLEMYAFYKY